MDAGDVAQHVGLDPEAVEGRLQPRVDLHGGQPAGSIDMGQARDGDVLEEHGHGAGDKTEPYRLAPSGPGRMELAEPDGMGRRLARSGEGPSGQAPLSAWGLRDRRGW